MKQTLTKSLFVAAVLGLATPAFAQMSNTINTLKTTDSVPPENAAANPTAGDGSNSGTPSSSSHYKAKKVHHPKKTHSTTTSATSNGNTTTTTNTTDGMSQ